MERLKRGCGYRVINGLYLVGTGLAEVCEKLPHEIACICPVCGAGIKQSRGLQVINPQALGLHAVSCGVGHCVGCPLGLGMPKKVGMMWVGEKFYPSPGDFVNEARRFGVSKRIASIPKNIKLNETCIFLAHRKGISKLVQPEDCKCRQLLTVAHEEKFPAVFYAFKPTRIEMPIARDTKPNKLEALHKRGIVPVMVDMDADGKAIEYCETEKPLTYV